MRGKHSIVTPKSTVRRRLKIASIALVPAMVLASFGVASAELSADEQLAKDIECDIPGSGRTDCAPPPPPEEAPEPEAPEQSSEAAGTGATGADQSSTGSEAGTPGPAGDGTSQQSAPAEVSSGSPVIDDTQGFADALSCELMERFEMTELECAPAL